MRTALPQPSWIFSIAAKVVFSTVVVLAVAGAVVVTELSAREREHLVTAKRATAERIAELFVAYDAVSLAFGDEAGVKEDLETLGSTPHLAYAAVWSTTSVAPIASVGSFPGKLERPAVVADTRIGGEVIDVVRPIRSAEGDALGVALVRMSLAPENQAYVTARQRIMRWTAIMTGAVAALLVLVVRMTVTRPLGRLAAAARRLEQGERVNVGLSTRDEVGTLSRAFDTMTAAIVDREAKLVAIGERLQNVLDHMGQIIVVFGADRRMESERSLQAKELIGNDTDNSIDDMLFGPDGTPVEREAFVAWTEDVFRSSAEDWLELSELAPAEASRKKGGEERTYELSFKPLFDGGAIRRLMLVATDVTEQRALLQRVEKQDKEHARRIAVMRRLVAGGGQVFVGFLEAARYRLRTAAELLPRVEKRDREAAAELFRHVHTLRGEARCFDLDDMERELASIEFELADVRTRKDENFDLSSACATIRRRLGVVSGRLDAAQALFVAESPVGDAILNQVTVRRSDITQLSSFASSVPEAARNVIGRLLARPFGEVVFFVSEAVPRWLAREGKQATLSVQGRDIAVPKDVAQVLTGVLPHLVRNAIAHGVEGPDEREALGKPRQGAITVECSRHERGVLVRVSDDGAGFDDIELAERARALGFAKEYEDFASAFASGVSTREKTDEIAGFGIGLDAVRRELDTVGYTIRIESKSEHGSRITLEPRA